MRVKITIWSLIALIGLLFAPIAHADLVSPVPPECEGHPEGTACIRGDGTAGLCHINRDSRRPGRTFVTCEADAHECDRLVDGAVCHGYLHRPSHCHSFTNPSTHEHWRACVADTDAGTPNHANATDTTLHPVVTSRASLGHCSIAPGRNAPSRHPRGLALGAAFALRALGTRRRGLPRSQAV